MARKVGRNSPCPCGSGRKHKTCCLAREAERASARRIVPRVWEELAEWGLEDSTDGFEEAFARLAQTTGLREPYALDVTYAWYLLDRELEGAGTVAERFAARPELSPAERRIAEELAACRLGLWRVLDRSPGEWIELESVTGTERVRVMSDQVSRQAVRWDAVLARVARLGPEPELWGPAAIYSAHEEDEVVSEIERLAAEAGLPADAEGLHEALRRCALELISFMPPSRSVEPSFYTYEGDEVADASATWRIPDAEAAVEALCARDDIVWTDETEDGEGDCLEWTGDRRELAARRPELPQGAIVFESAPIFVDEEERRVEASPNRIGLATLEVRPGELYVSALSVERLDGAIELVAGELGPDARLEERRIKPIDLERSAGRSPSRRSRQRRFGGLGRRPGRPTAAPEPAPAGGRPEHGPPAPRPPSAVSPEVESGVLAVMMRERYRRLLDEPAPSLGGLTPREATTRPDRREDVEAWVRRLENAAERDRSPGTPDLGWLREELGLPDPLADDELRRAA